MSTEAQINANRLNAEKSTGPKTPEGKSVASQNSFKHGLRSASDVISSESLPEFESFRDRMLADLDPKDGVESMLADRIVSLSWRLRRTALVHTQTTDFLNKDYALDAVILPRRFQLPEKYYQFDPQKDPSLTLGRMTVGDFKHCKILERLFSYEQRFENSLFKTILEYQKLKLIRKQNVHQNDTDI